MYPKALIEAVGAHEGGFGFDGRRTGSVTGKAARLILDDTAGDLESTKPFPSTAIVSLRSDDTAVSIDLFTTGQGSEQRSWFGGDSVNLVGCARITARPGGQTTASGTECGRAVDAVFTSPWEQVRLHP